jgi:hypothetical protein
MIEHVKIAEKSAVEDTMSELVSKLAKRKIETRVCQMADIVATKEGLLIAENGSDQLPISDTGIDSFLRKLKPPMPKSYSWKIGNDQLLYDIGKLVENDMTSIAYRVEDGVITGFHSTDFTPLDHHFLINKFIELDGVSIRNAQVSDKSMRMTITMDGLIDPIGPRDDQSRLGLEVMNSETGWHAVKTALLTYRLVCANGAIALVRSHTVTHRQMKREVDAIIEPFFAGIANLEWSGVGTDLNRGIEYMMQNLTGTLDLVPVTRTNQTERPGIEGVQHLIKTVVGKDHSEQILAESDDESSQYDIYNVITSAAQRFEMASRARLERVGGLILSDAMRLAA